MTTKASIGVVDPNILDRANHTGEQPISSVTGLQSELDGLQPISGTWAPVVTTVSNASSATLGGNSYYRIGNIIHCFGFASIAVVSNANVVTRVDVSLPVPSDFSSSGDLRGVFTTTNTQRAGAIYAEVTDNTAVFQFTAETAPQTFSYAFDYVVQ